MSIQKAASLERQKMIDIFYQIEGKTKIAILSVLIDEFPRFVQIIELANKTDIHRSTISVHCRELLQLKVIEQEIEPKTENKIRPTYLFRICPNSINETRKFLQVKMANGVSMPSEDSTKSDLKRLLLEMAQRIILLETEVALLRNKK